MNTNCALDNDLAGILIIGGSSPSSQSVEFWSAADPEQGSCVLKDYPRDMNYGPTANLLSGRLVACFEDTCEIYQEGSWEHLQNTTARRQRHNSATTEDAVLLIGGGFSNSTELIRVDGSPFQPGSFTVRRHGMYHCTSQLSDGFLVLTGGKTPG